MRGTNEDEMRFVKGWEETNTITKPLPLIMLRKQGIPSFIKMSVWGGARHYVVVLVLLFQKSVVF